MDNRDPLDRVSAEAGGPDSIRDPTSWREIPEWAKAPLRRALGIFQLIDEVLHLSTHGIAVLQGMPEVVEALAGVREDDEDDEHKTTVQSLAVARREAELAHREVDQGFPLLHGQALLSLCGALEALIRDFLAAWLRNLPSVQEANEIKGLRVKLGEYSALDEEDRAFYVLDLLEQKLGSLRMQGATRFEALLKVVSLGGAVHADIRRQIFEMFKIRNVLIHRSGIADRKFRQECPWLEIQVGDTVTVSNEAFRRYQEVVVEYVLDLICRVGEYFAMDYSTIRADQAKRLAEKAWVTTEDG